jgi:arabinose-5-phosphate isomerase
MRTGEDIPTVPLGATARQAIEEMDNKKIGATLVTDADRKLAGIISDGDLRRALLRGEDIYRMAVEQIMSPSPKTIDENKTGAEALGMMEAHGITHLVIVDAANRVEGIVHLHDLLGRKDFTLK